MEKIDSLIFSYLSGNATNEEHDQLMIWMEESESNRNYFTQLKLIWLSADNSLETSQIKIWERLNNKIHPNDNEHAKKQIRRIHFGLKQVLNIAASLFIIAGFSVTYRYISRTYFTSENAQNVFEVPYGSQSKLNLPDGTKLWINSGSKITYNKGFGKNNRDIFLTGEAFFDVAKNRKLPFVVHAGNLKIIAIGTSFNVKAYPEEKKIETTLIQGLVEIKKEGVQKPILLHPKEKFISTDKPIPSDSPLSETSVDYIRKDKNIIQVDSSSVAVAKVINTEKEVSWKEGKLIFEREVISSLVLKLERRYDVKFEFRDEKLKDYQFTGAFKDLSLEQILEAIKLFTPMDFEINGNRVILKMKTP